MQLATLTVLAATYTVFTLALLAHQNVSGILNQWGDSVKMSVYLDDELELDQVETIKKAIENIGSFNAIDFISKEKAAESFMQQMASYAPGFLSDLEGENPLPMSFELSLGKDLVGPLGTSKLEKSAEALRKIEGVEEISYGQGWIENYSSLVNSFSTTSWVLVALLLAGSLLVVGNSIRNSINQRRQEIEILELIGATSSYIRIPYLFEGMMMGLIASVFAIVVSYMLFSWQSEMFNAQLGFLRVGTSLHFLQPSRILAILIFGSGSGLVGALLCLRKLSSGWAAAEALSDRRDR